MPPPIWPAPPSSSVPQLSASSVHTQLMHRCCTAACIVSAGMPLRVWACTVDLQPSVHAWAIELATGLLAQCILYSCERWLALWRPLDETHSGRLCAKAATMRASNDRPAMAVQLSAAQTDAPMRLLLLTRLRATSRRSGLTSCHRPRLAHSAAYAVCSSQRTGHARRVAQACCRGRRTRRARRIVRSFCGRLAAPHGHALRICQQQPGCTRRACPRASGATPCPRCRRAVPTGCTR